MKRLIISLLLAAVLAALPGCASPQGATQLTFDQVVQAVLPPEQPEGDDLVALNGEDPEALGSYLLACYGLEEGQWTDAVVYRRQGAYAYEIAVVLLGQEEDAAQLSDRLEAHRLTRQGAFTGYAPDQAELARLGQVARRGQYLALFICEDPQGALDRFYQCFGERHPARSAWASSASSGVQELYAPFDPPGEMDMTPYDTAPILAAWRSGQEDGLSQYDREILSRCRQLLDELVTEGMSQGEQELALYRWLTEHVAYDPDHYSDTNPLDPASTTPYGPLVNGKGICQGYAAAFQLFMDLLDIECITVTGAAFSSAEDHAWNMVRLDGAWYCADPTWDLADDHEGRPLMFFNVTSQFMAQTDHQWDYDNTPVADTLWTGPTCDGLRAG